MPRLIVKFYMILGSDDLLEDSLDGDIVDVISGRGGAPLAVALPAVQAVPAPVKEAVKVVLGPENCSTCR